MSSSSPEPPASPREGRDIEEGFALGGDGKMLDSQEMLQDVQLTYKDEFANEVLVYTSLDDFHEGIRMNRVESDGQAGEVFETTVPFPPGRHLYRYLVDGEWMCDEIKEVTYLQGNAYNEIEVEQPSALLSKQALKRKEKRKKWKQKKKIAKQKRRALDNIDSKDPKGQNLMLAATLKAIENSTAAKLVAAEEAYAKSTEEIKSKHQLERNHWSSTVTEYQTAEAALKKKLAELQKDIDSGGELRGTLDLENKQNKRRILELEAVIDQNVKEKAELEKKERDAEEESKATKRRLKALKGELQAKFEKQIEEVTAAMEAELRNTSVNIFYLKKEIEKHKTAEETAEENARTVTAQLEVAKKERDAASLQLAEAKAEVDALSTKISSTKSVADETSKEVAAMNEKYEKLDEKLKAEVAAFERKQEEFKRLEKTLLAEKAALTEAETKSKEESKKLRDQIFTLQSDLTTQQAKTEAQITEFRAQLQATRDSSLAEKSTVEKKLEELQQNKESELSSVSSRLDELRRERDEAVARVEKDLKEQTDKAAALAEAKSKVETELAAAQGEIKTLQERTADLDKNLNAKITEAKTKLQALQEEKETAEAAVKKSASELAILQKQKEAREAEWKVQEEKLSADIASLNKKLEEEVKNSGTVQSELMQEKKAKEKNTAQIAALEQLVKDRDTEKASMVDDHKGAITALEAKLTETRATVSKQEAELEKSKNALEKARDELKAREDALQKEMKVVQDQLSNASTKHQLIKTKLKSIAGEAREFATIAQALKMAQVQAASGISKALSLFEKNITRSIEQYSKLLEETLQKYKKEMTERRKFFNLVQELRGNIRVSIRARPFTQNDVKRGATDEAKVPALKFPDTGVISLVRGGVNKEYEFDRVFVPTSTQIEVFKDTSQLIRSCMDGYNVCIIAYGQTGSGKTFTMEGPEDDRGVNFRALRELFNLRKARKDDYVYEISVSMLEIYNENLCDLLSDNPDASAAKVNIRHGKDGIFVENLTEVEVETEEDVIKYMKIGAGNRAIGKTNMNEHSSRSHSILTVNTQGHNFTAGITYYGKLHLLDLAGSERVSKSGATGERLEEAKAINKSLSALGNVLHSLQLKSKHIPYRDSKLTYLLQDSLGGNSKCMMFINLSPTLADVEETYCSLEFAARVARVELGQAVQNKARKTGEEPTSPTPAGGAPSGTPAKAAAKTTTGTPAATKPATGTATTPAATRPGVGATPGVAAKPGDKKTAPPATGARAATSPAAGTTAPAGAAKPKTTTPAPTGAKAPAAPTTPAATKP